MGKEPRILDLVRERIRLKHYSIRTEDTYLQWIRRFILFHGKVHPRDLGHGAIEAFLTHLAVRGGLAASTQNQAMNAILFLYREVLQSDRPDLGGIVRATRTRHLPVVLTRAEVAALLSHLQGVNWMMASLLYGSGLRLMGCVRLRVKDLDIDRREIVVRDGKGAKDRVTVLPGRLVEPLRQHLQRVHSSTNARSVAGMPVSTCRLRWNGSTRTRASSGGGSGCFRPARLRWIRAAAACAVIT